jgi:hypothetical protein
VGVPAPLDPRSRHTSEICAQLARYHREIERSTGAGLDDLAAKSTKLRVPVGPWPANRSETLSDRA